jgi:hypothetical protein
MEICFPLPFGRYCIYIPLILIPIVFPPVPHPDPGPYAGLVLDATILTAVNEAAGHITDETVRQALQSGIAASVKGMQAKAGKDIEIKLAAPAKSAKS